MTVKELIEYLEQQSPDVIVWNYSTKNQKPNKFGHKVPVLQKVETTILSVQGYGKGVLIY